MKSFNSILIVLQLTSISNDLTEGLITVTYLTAVTSEVSRHLDVLKDLLSDSGCQLSFGTSFNAFFGVKFAFVLHRRCVRKMCRCFSHKKRGNRLDIVMLKMPYILGYLKT